MANFSVDLSPLFKVYDWWTGIQRQKQADAAFADVSRLAQAGDVVTQQKTDAQPAWTPPAPTTDFLSASLMQQQPQIPQVPTPQQYNITETRTPYQQSPAYRKALWELAKYNPKIAEKLIMPDKDENLHFVTNPNAEGAYTAVNPKTGKPVYKEAGTPIPKKPTEQLAEIQLSNKQEQDKWTQTINQLIAQYENPNTSKDMLPGIKQYVRENFGEHPVAAKWLADVEKDKSITGAQNDQRYYDIQTRAQTDPKSVTSEERAFVKAYEKGKTLGAAMYGATRMSVMMDMPVPVYDEQEGTYKFVSREEALKSGGRYKPQAGSTKTLNQNMLIEDISGSIKLTKESLQKMPEFTAKQAAQVAVLMKHPDPRGAMAQFIQSGVGQTITPEQQDYIINLLQLKEQVMSMRSILGAGQGSDMMRDAIDRTTPGAATPSKGYAIKQLDAMEKTLQRVRRFVPNIKPSRPDIPEGNVDTPKLGDVVKGYRFKGGDPSDQKNWVKVK